MKINSQIRKLKKKEDDKRGQNEKWDLIILHKRHKTQIKNYNLEREFFFKKFEKLY